MKSHSDRARYFIITCPEAPSLQMVSFNQPHVCPICHCRGMRTEKYIESNRWEEIVAVSHN